jgi:H+/Cl- antiporter ClcA/predicted transcriptional regulator
MGDSEVVDTLRDLRVDRRLFLLSAFAVAIGILSALVAWVLLWLIGTVTNIAFYGRLPFWDRLQIALVSPAGNHLGLWVVLVPVIGGLIVGFMAKWGSDKIRGHGIPEALEAILLKGSRVEPRVAVLKPISAAVAIGTGGPFGAEGPIIMTGGALGSVLAQSFHLTAAERRILLVSGAAGGMAAVFSAPVAATLLAVELMLFEWRPRSLIPVAIAAVVAAVARIPLLGGGPIFPTPPHAIMSWQILLAALLVGIVGAILAALVTRAVYGCEDLFRQLPIHWMWWPAIGGIFVGLAGLISPRVLGVGYDTIGLLLAGQILGAAALGILVGKAIVWSIALGSGTSGGVLAPLLMMGAAMGVLLSMVVSLKFTLVDVSAFAIFGMAATMAGAMRIPLTGAIFAVELTHDWNILPGLLVACAVAHGITALAMRRSILTEKLARRGQHVTHEYEVDPMQLVRVAEVMTTPVITVRDNEPASVIVPRLASAPKTERTGLSPRAVPVVDERGHVVGVVTIRDVYVWQARHGSLDGVTTKDLVSRAPVTVDPSEVAAYAADLMAQEGVGRMPVVDRRGKIVGILSRSDLLQSRVRRIVEETERARFLFTSGSTPAMSPPRGGGSPPASPERSDVSP